MVEVRILTNDRGRPYAQIVHERGTVNLLACYSMADAVRDAGLWLQDHARRLQEQGL